jgi:TorA maturation chaperone TorD
LNEKPLARLRSDLTALGLARDETMSETEDHVAYLCEVMRFLIAGEDAAISNLTQQQKFFSAHLQPWILLMCDDLQAHPKARFYSALGALTSAFMGVETQGFDMMDTA